MDKYTVISLWVLASYLIGGIPFGFLIGKARGIDVRTVGSKNIGATNVFRTVGKSWGFVALALDMAKGFFPVFLCKRFLPGAEYFYLPLSVGIGATVGHMLTPYMKFKGGKGVATGAGMLLGLLPALTGVTLLVFVGVFALSNYISLGSCTAAAFIGVMVWFKFLSSPGVANLPQCILVSLIAAFVIWKHRANIKRLAAGNENKIYIFGKNRNRQ